MIVTPVRGQVLGVVKAEVTQTPFSPSQSPSLRPNSNSRPPLTNTSFGPANILKEEEVSVSNDPFTDENTPHLSPGIPSIVGVHGSNASTISDWTPSPFSTVE
jgi:hypothetical protein